ncbi:hypothetical protein Barb6XT_00768 [Bacteroidales bacterium Barb6XT]|nr:hypothetical protein Barb6XT_00768 [Bacteroidales bacterium Barb6XT]
MHNIIPYGKLVQFLNGQCYLPAAGFLAFEVKLVEAVKQLMVGEEAHFQALIGKALMQRFDNARERQVVFPFLKDAADTVVLLLRITQYI